MAGSASSCWSAAAPVAARHCDLLVVVVVVAAVAKSSISP
jgi:hypothetical protein